jgi:hypothetical protein
VFVPIASLDYELSVVDSGSWREQFATVVGGDACSQRKPAPDVILKALAELDEDVRGDHFNLNTVRARLLKLRRDPWADYDSVRHTITARMKRSLGIK